jgi:hypothetical protein
MEKFKVLVLRTTHGEIEIEAVSRKAAVDKVFKQINMRELSSDDPAFEWSASGETIDIDWGSAEVEELY